MVHFSSTAFHRYIKEVTGINSRIQTNYSMLKNAVDEERKCLPL